MSATSDSKYNFLTFWLLVVITGLAIMIVYAPVLADQPLLDEQYILKWVGSITTKHSNRWAEFFSWHGPDAHDAWGFLVPLNLLLSGAISDIAKFYGIFGHWLNTVLLFLVARRVTVTHDEKGAYPLIAIFAAVLFAIYPLAPEAVSYLGGRGCVMGVTFVLLSFWVYLYGRQLKTKEELRIICISASVLSYMLAILCDLGFWSSIFAFIGFEYAERIAPLEREPRTLNQTMRMIAGQCVVAVCAQLAFITQGHFGPLPQFSDFPRVLYRMLCPVSNINSEVATHCTILLAAYTIPMILLFVSWKTSARQRRVAVLSIYWILGALVSNAALAAISDDLYGARWLYSASVPLCFLLGASIGAATTVTNAFKPITAGISILLCLIVSGVFVKLTWTQTQSYYKSGETLKRIQKAVKQTTSKAHKPFAILSNLPPDSSVVPILSRDRIICMDTETGLVRAYNVSPGHLRNCWRKGLRTRESITWNMDTIIQMPEASKAQKEFKQANQPEQDSKDSGDKKKQENLTDLPLEAKLARLMDPPPGVLGRMPLVLTYVSNRSPAPRNEFKDLCYDFPNAPELGLLRMFGRHNTLRFVYDVTAIPGAKKVLIEISHPNKFLGAQNTTELSPYRYRTTAGSIPKSEKVLRAQFFPGKGVYEIRMIACDKKKKPLGSFGDSVNVQLTY